MPKIIKAKTFKIGETVRVTIAASMSIPDLPKGERDVIDIESEDGQNYIFVSGGNGSYNTRYFTLVS
jgi:hypothetical protein